jgi:hypothetical protein
VPAADSTKANAKHKPFHQFKVGPVVAKVFENEGKDGKPWFNISIQRIYRLPEGQRDGDRQNGYRHTPSYSGEHLTHVTQVVKLAQEFIDGQTQQ